ncbi:MAG: type III pantothenate kinase [Nitrospirae bacterium]|nr:MAG: type III pantothenate kinase [Nitrospirota bacterium]
MLLCVDIGNSSIAIGYDTGPGLVVQRLDTHPLRTGLQYSAEISAFMAEKRIENNKVRCIISSVVPGHTHAVAAAVRQIAGGELDILHVGHTMKTGLAFDVKTPEELGADRIATAAGAYEVFRGPVAVVDFGTATTVTVVDEKASLIGGAIMPGPGLMNAALQQGTAKLKQAALEAPQSPLGRDTSECIRTGIFYGSAGAVERIIAGIGDATGKTFRTVITGGYCQVMKNYLQRPYDIRPYLIFEGLKILYDKNRP